MRCQADECLYGGAAGGGKSWALLRYSIERRHRYPGSRGVIFRRTYPELSGSGCLIPRSQEVLRGVAEWHATSHTWRFPDGGSIQFAYCANEADVYRYQGAEWDDLCIDEAGHFTEFQHRYLRSRVRTTRTDLTTQIRLSANPGNVGHVYLKSRYVDPQAPGTVWTPEATALEPAPRSRCYIPARVYDNRVLLDADPQYLANLQALPERERMALLEGRWDLFIGQMFEEWCEEVHVVDPFEIPRHWRRICALDWGFNHPTVVLWGAVDEDGVVWVYRELWLRRTPVDGPDGLAARIRRYPDSDLCRFVAAGPDVFTMQSQALGGPRIAELFRDNGVTLTNVCARTHRVDWWQQVRRYLHWRDAQGLRITGRPLVRIFRGACPRLLATLPVMVQDPDDPEDMLKVDADPDTGEGGDDAVDALAHLLMARPRSSPSEEQALHAARARRLSNPFNRPGD